MKLQFIDLSLIQSFATVSLDNLFDFLEFTVKKLCNRLNRFVLLIANIIIDLIRIPGRITKF